MPVEAAVETVRARESVRGASRGRRDPDPEPVRAGRPNLMLLGRERLFYSGLLGNSGRIRQLGALTIYAARSGRFELSVGGAPPRRARLACVPPQARHRIVSEDGLIATLSVEPESVRPAALRALAERAADPETAEAMADRIQAACRRLELGAEREGFSTEAFDILLLGAALDPRPLDPRLREALDRAASCREERPLAAEDCAQCVGLSTSHFLHVFGRETGLRFRSWRMWKRARRLMAHVDRPVSLTRLAQELGYPDSTHFSHSIRRIYGLTPRSIYEGSRGLQVIRGERMGPAAARPGGRGSGRGGRGAAGPAQRAV